VRNAAPRWKRGRTTVAFAYGQGGFSASTNPFGEIAPSRSDFRQILGRVPSEKEHNFFKSLYSDDESRSIHKLVESLVQNLVMNQTAKNSLMERVEGLAKKLIRTKNLGRSDSVLSALCTEASSSFGIGPVELVKRVAEAYPSIARLNSLQVRVKCPDPSRVKVFVGGAERTPKVHRDGMVYLLKFPLYIFDDGAIVKFENGKLAQVSDRRARVIDERTLLLKIDPRKAFELFKLMKKAIVDLGTPRYEKDFTMYLRRFPISSMPVTEWMMRQAGCLHLVQRRFAEIFREKLENGMGRSPGRLAVEALTEADREVYAGMTPERRAHILLLLGKLGIPGAGDKGLILDWELRGWER
jgi:hypothetical protein